MGALTNAGSYEITRGTRGTRGANPVLLDIRRLSTPAAGPAFRRLPTLPIVSHAPCVPRVPRENSGPAPGQRRPEELSLFYSAHRMVQQCPAPTTFILCPQISRPRSMTVWQTIYADSGCRRLHSRQLPVM